MGICEHLTRKSLDLSVVVEQPIEICISGGQLVESYKPIKEDQQQQQQHEEKLNDEKSSNRISSSSSSTLSYSSTDGGHVEEATLAKKPPKALMDECSSSSDEKSSGRKMHDATIACISKEELLLYANDPFWVRLRCVCFILFWAIWIAMLLLAVLIMVKTPKCAAPSSLKWYERGYFIDTQKTLDQLEDIEQRDSDMKFGESINAKGVIYALPPQWIYDRTKQVNIERVIEQLIEQYKRTNMHIIIDMMPNLVLNHNAWATGQTIPKGSDELVRSPQHFGNDKEQYDLLLMNNEKVRQSLVDVVQRLVEVGVRGIRFKNTDDYTFTLATERSGDDIETLRKQELTDFLQEFEAVVGNVSTGQVFTFPTTGEHRIGENATLFNVLQHAKSYPDAPQWNLMDIQRANEEFPASSLLLFVAMLPGVCVIPNTQEFNAIPDNSYKLINTLHVTATHMHGQLSIYEMGDLLAYSRHRAGNPGYFVLCNPTNATQHSFIVDDRLPAKMSVYAKTANIPMARRSKVLINGMEIPPYAVIIHTYVATPVEN